MNKHLTIMKGLQASGKTTASFEMLQNNKNMMRVNRDEIRKMCQLNWSGKREGAVIAAEAEMVKAFLKSGFDVVVDDTNLSEKTINRWIQLAESLKATYTIEDFCNLISIEECIKRDSNRENPIGRAVIERTALFNQLLPPLEGEVVICDIDGTIADCSHRQWTLSKCRTCDQPELMHPNVECQEYTKGWKDFSHFFDLVPLDTPIQTVIDWMKALDKAGVTIILVSGRPTDLTGIETHTWMEWYDVPYKYLFMRQGGDYRQDFIIKQEILDAMLKWIRKDQIKFVVDDRMQVVKMWKSNGLTVYPVSQGDGDF